MPKVVFTLHQVSISVSPNIQFYLDLQQLIFLVISQFDLKFPHDIKYHCVCSDNDTWGGLRSGKTHVFLLTELLYDLFCLN